MIRIYSILFLLAGFACGSEVPENEPVADPELGLFEVEVSGSTFATTIAGSLVRLSRPLPFGTTQVKVKTILTSTGSTASLAPGEMIAVTDQTVRVVNSQGKEKQYSLELPVLDYASIVSKYGRLRTKGARIVGESNEPVSLAGNSFFWSNTGWGGEKYYTRDVVNWLKLDWGTTIIRAALGVDESGGYNQYKTPNLNRIKVIVDAALEAGVYVIVDFHSHHAEDYQAEAIEFFTEMATLYGGYDNIIYEIYNEPLNVSWSSVIKPYAAAVISAIRAKDPDNLIIVGTPEWSQRVDLAANDPITDANVAYTLHFYTVYHQQWLRDRATAALNQGIPLFVTEWGSIGYSSQDPETDRWMLWCKQNHISHCNWAVNDKKEEWSILAEGSATNGNWKEFEITAAGKLARTIIRDWHD